MYLDPENQKKFLLVKSKDKKRLCKSSCDSITDQKKLPMFKIKVKEEITDSHSQGSLRLTEEIV